MACEDFKEKIFAPVSNKMKKYGVEFCAQWSKFCVKKDGEKVGIKCIVCSQKRNKQKNAQTKKKQHGLKNVIANPGKIGYAFSDQRLGPCIMFSTTMKIKLFAKLSLQPCQQCSKMTSKIELIATYKALRLLWQLIIESIS